MSTRTVSVIIPALNEEQTIESLLLCLNEQVFQIPTILSVIVVDNGSKDQTNAIAEVHKAKIITVMPHNRSIARNAGAQAVINDDSVVVFLDCDCRFGSSFLDKLTERLFEENNTICQAFLLPRGAFEPLSHMGEVFVDTKACAMKVSDFKEIGGFDCTLPRCEDIDFGWKLNRNGKAIAVVRAAECHTGEISSFLGAIRRGKETAFGLACLHEKWKNIKKLTLFEVLKGFCLISSREAGRIRVSGSVKGGFFRLVDNSVTFSLYWVFRIRLMLCDFWQQRV